MLRSAAWLTALLEGFTVALKDSETKLVTNQGRQRTPSFGHRLGAESAVCTHEA
jgi:hypothetical protein